MGDFMKQIWPSLVVSVLVGMGASYLTASKTIAVFESRITRAEADIKENERTHERDQEAIKATLKSVGSKMEDLRVQVARGDAKLDILIGLK